MLHFTGEKMKIHGLPTAEEIQRGAEFGRELERNNPPQSWHSRFIAERCGGMQRWRRVSLAAYLEDAEAEYGEPLPIPKLLITEEFSDCTVATMQWPTVSGVVTLYFGLRGFSINGLPSRDPAQLATALRELFQREHAGNNGEKNEESG